MNSNTLKQKHEVRNIILSYGFYIFLLIFLIIMGIINPAFFTAANFASILSDSTMLLIAAAGVTMVIITGNMDLSIGSVAFVGTACMDFAQSAGLSPVLGVILALLFGLIAGLINGLLVGCLKLNSMLITLGLMIAYRGLGQIISGGSGQIRLKTSEVTQFGKISIGGLSVMFLIAIAIIVVLVLVLRKTRFGAYSYAVGNNQKSAEILGLPVKKVIIGVFVIAGICGALSGIATVLKLGTYTKYAGQGLEFDAIAAVVIGGTSLYGGKGNILPGTFFGVFMLSVIRNALTFAGASTYMYDLLQGVVIFLAMYLDSLSTQKIKSINT